MTLFGVFGRLCSKITIFWSLDASIKNGRESVRSVKCKKTIHPKFLLEWPTQGGGYTLLLSVDTTRS